MPVPLLARRGNRRDSELRGSARYQIAATGTADKPGPAADTLRIRFIATFASIFPAHDRKICV